MLGLKTAPAAMSHANTTFGISAKASTNAADPVRIDVRLPARMVR
jgi:hypothetical protein